ncbi:MAG: cytochrome c-type biogenesis protein [Alphaproteobacteria bacterium]
MKAEARAGVAGLYLLVSVLAAGALLVQDGVGTGLVGAPPAAAATNPDEILDDPVLELRARELSKELRCLVCQNQSIDDSDADLAHDLRQLVRERLLAGDSDEEVIAFVTERYGDFVLLRPPIRPSTWGLWYGPPAIFGLAAIAIVFYMRRRRSDPVQAPAEDLSAEEQTRLDRLLGRESSDPT